MKFPGREQEKSKRQRRGRGARRGRGRRLVVEPSLEPEEEPDPQPDSQEEAEPAASEPAPPQVVHQEQPPTLTIHGLASGMQPGVAEGELAARSQETRGELPGRSCAVPHLHDCCPPYQQPAHSSTRANVTGVTVKAWEGFGSCEGRYHSPSHWKR